MGNKRRGDVPDRFDPIPLVVRVEQNLDHVESYRQIRGGMARKPDLRRADDMLLLFAVDGGGGTVQARFVLLVKPAGLHLDENERFAAFRHDVEFGASRAVVPLENAVEPESEI